MSTLFLCIKILVIFIVTSVFLNKGFIKTSFEVVQVHVACLSNVVCSYKFVSKVLLMPLKLREMQGEFSIFTLCRLMKFHLFSL